MARIIKTISILLITIFSFSPCLSQAEDDNSEHLFSDWNGYRTYWQDHGLDVNAVLGHTFMSNLEGGADRGEAISGDLDLVAEVDTEKADLWSNGTFFFYFLGTYGDEITKSVSNLQVVDNTEAYSTFKLYEAWYEHRFFEERLGVLLGLHDFNSEFDVLEYSGTLINSSFGISPDIALAGPSIFPATSLALRVKGNLTKSTYLQSAIYDGVPGDPDRPQGTRIKFENGDGLFWGSEVGYVSESEPFNSEYFKVAVGFWYHTKDFTDFQERERNKNHGIYFIAEKNVYAEESENQGLGVFFQSGFVPDDSNQISEYYGAGLAYTGLIPCRDEDVISFGFANARNSSDYLELNPEMDNFETIYELTYRYVVNQYFALQPDIQYVKNPALDPSVDDSIVAGVRAELSL